MGANAYANGRSIACKAADGKSICSFPDVCLSPPSPPAGPVPIPYPNTGMASDTTGGSKSVKVAGKEAVLKDSSCFKRSMGDEAATKTLGMGVITHQIQGKVFFNSWSMDVKIEGKNAARMMDLTTHNHASQTGQTPPWPYVDAATATLAMKQECKDEVEQEQKKCADAPKAKKGKGLDCSKNPGCAEAKACILQPKSADKSFCCSPNTTGHHLVEVHCMTATGGRAEGKTLEGFEKYDPEKAPCTCASPSRSHGTHGIMHSIQGKLEAAYHAMGNVLKSWAGAGPLAKRGGTERLAAESRWNYGQARDAGLVAHKQAFPQCSSACVKAQLDGYHNRCGINDETPLRTDPVPRTGGPLSAEQEQALSAEVDRISGRDSV